VTWWIGANLFFVLCHPQLFPVLPAPLRALAVGAVIFLMPAVGWRARFGAGHRALGLGVVRDVAISTVAVLGVLIAHRAVGAVPTQFSMWNATWLVTNLGFVVAASWRGQVGRRRSLTRTEMMLGTVLFLGSFAFYYVGATTVVPQMRDHDHEVQATGYGLATRFEPFLLTDRHTIYYFAHPPLLHFYVAESFLYFGAFPSLEYYDAATRRVLNATERRQGPLPEGLVPKDRRSELAYRAVGVEGSDYVLAPQNGGPLERASAELVELSLIVRRYEQLPYIIETRAPNIFLAAATVALLGIWGTRISRRAIIGLLMAVAYAANPEVFVRSSYGGYFAIGTFMCLLMLMAVDRPPKVLTSARLIPAILAGALTALADHKMVLLPAAAAMMLVPLFRTSRPRSAGLLVALVAGFAAGSALFWCLGLATAPVAFLQDHLYTHALDRVTHENPLGYGGYPTVAGLWSEFAAHSGYVLLPIGLLAMGYDVLRPSKSASRQPAPDKVLWLGWILLVAILFSIIDWRMTKHLVPILLPLCLGLVPDRRAPTWRMAVAVATFAMLIVWNAWPLARLVNDFGSFPMSPVW
jgi:hypothetical protein